MTDPIADFLTRIRNAVSVGHKVVEIPGSKIKLEMTKILKEKGYILNYKFEQEGARSNIKIALKYHPETKVPAIKHWYVCQNRVYVGTLMWKKCHVY